MKKLVFIILLTTIHISLFAQKKDTIVTGSGLKYVQLLSGNGKKPINGQKLKVNYTLRLLDGTIVESNMDDESFEFTLGNMDVIPGWDEGFKLLSEGERGYLIVPSKLAYGKRGSKDKKGKYIIPPDTDLIFEVLLVSFK